MPRLFETVYATNRRIRVWPRRRLDPEDGHQGACHSLRQPYCFQDRAKLLSDRKRSPSRRMGNSKIPRLPGGLQIHGTDHQSLRCLRNIKEPAGRLARWAIFLQQYDFDVQYRKGSQNQLADILSRQPCSLTNDDQPITIGVVKTIGRWYKRKKQEVTDRPQENKEYRIVDGNLYKKIWDPNDGNESDPGQEWKLCVPPDKRQEVLQKNNDRPDAGHLGITKTRCRMALRYYWPGMFRETAKYVRKRKQCQQHKPSQEAPPGHMRPPRVSGPCMPPSQMSHRRQHHPGVERSNNKPVGLPPEHH